MDISVCIVYAISFEYFDRENCKFENTETKIEKNIFLECLSVRNKIDNTRRVQKVYMQIFTLKYLKTKG